MSADAADDWDEMSFKLESVDEMVDDMKDVHVHNELIVNVDIDNSSVGGGISPPIDKEKKKKFERKRDEILSCVPAEVKARFGEIYFATFGKFVGPVLIMNPYHVEPGPLRDHWFTMFRNCQKSGREKEMTHLTYWYGLFNDLPNAYSFQKTSKLMSYEKGMAKIEKKIYGFQLKYDAGKKIATKDLNLMKGMEELEKDRKKDPAERSGYIDSNFLEEYHLLAGEDDEVEKEPQTKQQKSTKDESEPGGKKKKKIKKIKDSAQTDKQTTTKVVENGETSKPKKKISKKRSKKDNNLIDTSLRPKKKAKNVEGGDRNLEENGIDVNESGKGEDDTNGGTAKIGDKRPSAYEEFAGLGDVSSHGETDDENLQLDDLKSEDDSEDEDYMEKSKSKATKKKKAKSEEQAAMKSKEPQKKKLKKTKFKIENSVKGEKKSIIKLSLNKLLKKEQRKFQYCETEFLPLLRRWEKALNNEDVNQLSRIYEDLLTNMEHFTAPFIEEYGMSNLMRQSKGFDNDKRKLVLAKFKKVYKEKKDAVPQGFKAKKESEKYVSIDAKVEQEIDEPKHPKEPTTQPELEKDEQNPNQVVNDKNMFDTPQDTPMPSISKSSKLSRSIASDGEIAPPIIKLEASSRKQNLSNTKSEPSSHKQTQSTSKPEKKKRFSLGKLMRPGSSSSTPEPGGTKLLSSFEESSAMSSQSSKKNQTSPSWTVQTVSTEDYSNENRIFGLEFLQQATPYIPESKNVNHIAIARNLEIAIYNWSTMNVNGSSKKHEGDSEGVWLDKYWNKIHDLVAGISGKCQDGTLAGMIAEGKFATPDELVCLSDDDLLCSFQGSPLPGF